MAIKILFLRSVTKSLAKVVGSNGSGSISYRTALTAVFFEGLIFMFLALTGMRQWLVRLIPATIKTATGVGIGFFLTEIGLSYSSGIGAITGGGVSTPLSLGGCPPDMINAVTGGCNGGQMTNPTVSLSDFHRSPLERGGKTLTRRYADVARHLLWRHRHSLLDGFQGQVRPRHWNCPCLHHLMAVSLAVIAWSKHRLD